jgi:hypothetical protein
MISSFPPVEEDANIMRPGGLRSVLPRDLGVSRIFYPKLSIFRLFACN